MIKMLKMWTYFFLWVYCCLMALFAIACSTSFWLWTNLDQREKKGVFIVIYYKFNLEFDKNSSKWTIIMMHYVVKLLCKCASLHWDLLPVNDRQICFTMNKVKVFGTFVLLIWCSSFLWVKKITQQCQCMCMCVVPQKHSLWFIFFSFFFL